MSWSRSLFALAFLAACNLPDLPEVPSPGGGAEGPAEAREADSAQPLERGFSVRIRPVGPNGVIPREILVRASQPVFAPEEIGGPLPEGNALKLVPQTPGTWEVTALDTATFTPDRPLEPGREYQVSALVLGTGEARRPEEGETWATTFRTPEFAFQRMAMRERDPRAKRVAVELIFTGPVQPEDVAGKAAFRLGDTAVRPVYRGGGTEPNAVLFQFAGNEFLQDVPLHAEVALGVAMDPAPSSGAVATAMKGDGKVDLSAGQAMEIYSVTVKEGANGHYVDIVCNDEAGGPQRWWWDRETWEDYNVSERCEVGSEEAQRAIHFDPGVDLTVAPGPAGFRLFGDFERGEYHMTLDAGLRTADGGMLGSAYETQFAVPERSPSVQFAAKGRYLPRSAWDELGVRHVNVDAVELTVRHVPEENLVFWMSGDEPATVRTSNVVLKRRISVKNQPDREVESWIDVGTLLPRAGKGVYELKVRGIQAEDEEEEPVADASTEADTGWWHAEEAEPEESGPTDFSRILLTDLQIVAKLAAPGPEQEWAPAAHVWVLDTHDNRPVGGVDVRIVRPSGQTLGSCRTDLAGACTLELKQDPADDTPPMAIVARKADDLTYLKFSDLEIAPPGDTEGLAFLDEQPYRAAVYTDRGVYRPGDEAHVAAIIRDTATGFLAPSANLPVVAKLFDPRGKEMRKKVLLTNPSGLVAVDWPFGDFATTGSYRTVIEIGETVVGDTSFSVEEFVPERMKVEAAVEGEHLAEESVPVAISARWLFGGTAAGSEVELACQVVPGGFTPKQNKTYHYGLADVEDGSARRAVTLGTLAGVLDDEGRLTLDCPAAQRSGGFMGAATLVAQAAVFEGDSGRTTLGEARAPLHPERFYVGLASSTGKVGAGDDLSVSGVVVDWEGALDASQSVVHLDLVRLESEYVYTWDRDEHRYRYRRMLRRAQEDGVEVPVQGGKFATHLTPNTDATGYLVVASAGNARTELYIEGEGRRYWWWGGDTTVDQTPRPQKPGELAIEAPESTTVGEKITVHATAPYAGRMLFTAETHEVIDYRWVDVEAGPVEWTFKVHDYVPNVYVSTLLVKDPHLESAEAYLPDRAYGVRSVGVRPEPFTQTVKLDVPKEIQPYTTLDVGIDVGPQEQPTYVTVAAVDEGILSLTDFESPDPLKQIFARRALGVDTYETIGWTLLVPPGGPGRSTGGDGLAAGGRVQMVKPVALWSGVVEVPRSGKAKVSLEVPGYRGELRVMAVSATSKQLGHADAQVTVRDPIVLQTTLPRFLVGGDEALLPVFVSNMSGKDREIVVDLSVEDMELPGEKVTTDLGGDRPSPVVVVGDRQHRLTLADGASDTVLFKVRADRAPDAARFRVVAASEGLKSHEQIELPVERPEPEVRDTSRIVLAQGANDLSGVLEGWVEGSDRTRIWVTTNPYGQAFSHLRSVVRYPYGCIEQTTSSTRPLLYVSTIVDAVDPELAAEDPVDDMVRHGLQRILSMQTSVGGFAYWPGGSVPTEWGTAYATHLLLDAREAGFAVPDSALADALDWLGREVDKKGGTTADDFTTAYAHYVLARGGRARTAQAQTLLDNLGKRDNRYSYRELAEPRYLLMAAMYLGGDRRHEGELRKPDTSDLTNKRRNDWTFWSDLRSRAFQLAIYHDLFGSTGAEGQQLASIVGNGLATYRSYWYTTQEMAWGLTALGKWVGDGLGDIPAPTLTIGGRTIAPEEQKAKKGTDYVWSLSRATTVDDIRLDLPRTGGKTVYAVVSVQGVQVGGSPPASEGLVLQRTLLGADGKPLSTTHELGDPVYVRVSIRNTSGGQVQNVALVDRIPAGWEIENPRLGRGYRPDWLDDSSLWVVDHMNLRDDRVEVFGTLASGETRYVVYQVRAVTSGTFTHPPTTAEAMYDPRIQARTAPSRIKVVDPWGGS